MSSFNSITAKICYKCHRVALIALELIWVPGMPIALNWNAASTMSRRLNGRSIIPTTGQDQIQNNLDVFFVSCVVCQERLKAHNPRDSWIPLHVETRLYKGVVDNLAWMFSCVPKVPKIWAFSVTSWTFKTVSRVRDEDETLNTYMIPAENIMILKDGKEVIDDCRFFSHEPYMMKSVRRERAQYSQGAFASVKNKPALAHSSIDSTTCSGCLTYFSDAPPCYESLSADQDVKRPLLEFVGEV